MKNRSSDSSSFDPQVAGQSFRPIAEGRGGVAEGSKSALSSVKNSARAALSKPPLLEQEAKSKSQKKPLDPPNKRDPDQNGQPLYSHENGDTDPHSFFKRHIGPSEKGMAQILKALQVSSLKDLARQILPEDAAKKEEFCLPSPLTEKALLKEAHNKAEKNHIFKSYIGQGYNPSIAPLAIQKNILENPVWYSSYTPYQAELAQGRLEALLNFQTMTADLTGMDLANASLLDEGTALAEALALAKNASDSAGAKSQTFFADSRIFAQNLDVLKTRSRAFGWKMLTGQWESFTQAKECFALVLQYPSATGDVSDIEPFLRQNCGKACLGVVSANLLSLALLKPPGEMGADVVVGSSQNFGLPLFFGGPHAAFFATRKEFIRFVPGRLVGVSKDRHGKPAYRLSLQTREQHIRRDRATSNICTAQALPAVLASFYAVYHGPKGLRRIALKIHKMTQKLAQALKSFQGVKILNPVFFDTLTIELSSKATALKIYKGFQKQGINVGRPASALLSFALNETTEGEDILQIQKILSSFLPKGESSSVFSFSKNGSELPQQLENSSELAQNSFESPQLSQSPQHSSELAQPPQPSQNSPESLENSSVIGKTGSAEDDTAGGGQNDSSLPEKTAQQNALRSTGHSADLKTATALQAVENSPLPDRLLRKSPYLTHPVFNSYHSETELVRYIHRLAEKELSLTHSMIPLGSCTMKLNAAVELAPISWPAFADLHPFAPKEQSLGFQALLKELEAWLCELTGFKAFSFQPNAGSQGEYAGLLAIKKYHESRGETGRNICLIPSSAHGTNPASAVMAGLKPVSVRCDKEGCIDQNDIEQKLSAFGKHLACAMITYPSTYGFFEEGVSRLCQKIHNKGGLVYWDGANMNALLGLCKPAGMGFDLGHLNLHKSFCIPHGGGGPGVGPLGVSEKLKPFLPGHILEQNDGAVAEEGSPRDTAKAFDRPTGAVSSAPYGNAGALAVSWAYIRLMGFEGLRLCSLTALANANYIAERLKGHYRILFKGKKGRTAHECIIDLRKFRFSANITVDDVAKRLMDYSFHAPTMSWPEPGTLMIEPTESENKKELDRFCSALIAIKEEMAQAEKDKTQNALLKNAPHVIEDLIKGKWPFSYSKDKAFFPLPWIKERKFFPPVSRIENAYGDIQPFCSCPPVDGED